MSRRRGEIQVFSVSFLDVLSCALGGVLMLLLLNVQSAASSAKSYAEQAKSMQGQIDLAQKSLKTAKDALSKSQADVDAQRSARESLQNAQASLVGLQGDMGGVVFIFDTSGSMKTPRFDEYKQMLKEWVKHLEFKTFTVIEFNSEVRAWKATQLVPATPENRDLAMAFVDGLRADGETNTLGAFEAAFRFQGVRTIVLMSDGAPNQPVTEIYHFLASANTNRSVTINCVAMGNYFQTEYGAFLQRIAAEHRGMFIGR
jgi:Mg-chelatase subunit ChlD